MQATFEDELVEDALAKRHSLTCEAVQIGAQVCSASFSCQSPAMSAYVGPLFQPNESYSADRLCLQWLTESFLFVQSGAYRTILTHFSQRYPKIPKIEKSFLTTTCIAFDLMSINLKGMSAYCRSVTI